MMKPTALITTLATSVVSVPTQAYEATDKLSISSLLAGSTQCQDLSDTVADDECKGAVAFQPEVSFHPNDRNELFFKLGFADGNGLNNNSPFAISPWAADLEADVKDINGNDRDHLLTVWYKYSLPLSEDNLFGATFGIIDSTDYLDDNAYANDEFTQFMNAALVNGPNIVLPSYDGGGALEWDTGPWSARAVYMHVDENDDGNSYNFYGAQLGYSLENTLGEGTYRALVFSTSKDFLNSTATSDKKHRGIIFSFEQGLNEYMGGWLRIGWSDDEAAIGHDALYSGGIDFQGGKWGRPNDNIGLGYAYLDGGNMDINHSQVIEAYYRFVINDYLALSADIQHQQDDLTEESPEGFIFGLRVTAEI